MNHAFTDILIVLVAAKLAAEVAERLRVPAVAGEIVAGILIGPSVLGLVNGGDVLGTLGEIGVILLLLQVGMEMDLRDLRAVGRSSLMVACIGVALPMLMGYPIARAMGLNSNAALFTAAALTATSVGVTARVFGDLRALAMAEARTVLGAAVADDVIGLVILTVVVRLVTGDGTVTPVGILLVIGLAVGFLVVTAAIGSYVTPLAFAAIDRLSRSSGTMVALALAFTLGIAQLASVAKLAPIVGAFVAGISLGRTAPAERIRRELTPVGHLFIPVFFLEIGIRSEISEFVKPGAMKLAGVLIVIAIVTKVAAGVGAAGASGDKLLIGLGMIPRGEVGLIFAGIGLREGVLGADAYAALLSMVLATTLISPPLLAWRLRRINAHRPSAADDTAPRPPGGWLSQPMQNPEHRTPRGTVGLAARPPLSATLSVAFDAATTVAHAEPTPELIEWLRGVGNDSHGPTLVWDKEAVASFENLLRTGTARSWRLLQTTGALERALPELADALRARRAHLSVADPFGGLHFPRLDRVRRLREGLIDHPYDGHVVDELANIEHDAPTALIAFLLDALQDDPDGAKAARATAERMVLPARELETVAGVFNDRGLLAAAALRPDGLDPDSVWRLAAHLETKERARVLYVMTAVDETLEEWEQARAHELLMLLCSALDHPELTGPEARSLIERRRIDACRLVGAEPSLVRRVMDAPVAYVLAESPAEIARHVTLVEPVLARGRFRVQVTPDGRPLVWRVEVSARDQIGLLAIVTDVLERAHLDVIDAVLATWADGSALQAFRVRTEAPGIAPDADALCGLLTGSMKLEQNASPVPDAIVDFDNLSSPWHTIAEIRATDRRGLLHSLAVAFAAADVDVHAARVSTDDEMAFDRFDLTDRHGHKLDAEAQLAVTRALLDGVSARPRRFGRRSSRTRPA